MVTTRKKPKAMEPTPQPEWQSPRVPVSTDEITPSKKLTILELAQAVCGKDAPPEVLAAVIIAQAADRLADKMVEAAAVGRYRSGP